MGRRRSGETLTPGQRELLLREYALLPRDRSGRVERCMRQELARKWGVDENYPASLTYRQRKLAEAAVGAGSC